MRKAGAGRPERAGGRMLARLFAVAALATLTATLTGAGSAQAHPLGNFTVNQYSGLRLSPDRVVVDHVLDEAELAAVQTLQSITGGAGRNPGDLTPAQADGYRGSACAERAGRLALTVDGRPVPLRVDSARLEFPPGVAGLHTLRLTCSLSAPVDLGGGPHAVRLVTGNDEGRLGWREMTAVGDGVTLARSSVPAASVTSRLTVYPQDLLSSPYDVRTAEVSTRPGGARAPVVGDGPLTVLPRGVDALTQRFTEYAAKPLSPLVLAVGLAFSLALGVVHALSPGHGKTIMAAFLVGQRGRWRQVGVIGLTVTATHTLSVLAFGVLIAASVALAPQQVYPVLGVLSGLVYVGLGAGLLRTRWRGRRELLAALQSSGHGHPHEHDHEHDHEHPHPHPHPHPHEHSGAGGGTALAVAPATVETATADTPAYRVVRHSHGGAPSHRHVVPVPKADGRVGMPGLVSVGLAGGMVPSPSALLVLVGAIALHRAWYGVLLVVGYGVGMATTLLGVGLLLGRVRGRLERGARSRGRVAGRLRGALAALPVATSGVIVAVGLFLVVRGLAQLAAP